MTYEVVKALNLFSSFINFKEIDKLNLIKKYINTLQKEAENQAFDLVLDAYTLPKKKAIQNVNQALQLDPNCIEAYEFLASLTNDAEQAILHYEKAIKIGKKRFGGEYLKMHKGYFWGFTETRAYMRCLMEYADCLYILNQKSQAVKIYEDMLKLNVSDNQGVRYQLMLYLIELNETKKFKHYQKRFSDDVTAFAHYNLALFAFKQEGNTPHSRQLMAQALRRNKWIPGKIIALKNITQFADGYTLGSVEEADYYSYFAQHIWWQTDGAIAWLKETSQMIY